MPLVVYIHTPVGNGWSIVKVIKIPSPSNDEAA